MLNLQPGQKLAGFEIQGVLGTGGMGTVYLAFDPGLQQPRAIKVVKLPTETVGTRKAGNLKARFMQEARVLAALDHKNIIRVFQVGEVAGHPYLVMEYFVGRDLVFWLKSFEGLPPVEPVVHVVRQLAEALQYAHEQEHPVVHRDIKLANALLDANGNAKLIDFGLAKAANSEKLTETRASVGTLPYWAPEYVSASLYGDKPGVHTPVTDLWALGVVAYILLTNNYPIYDANQALLCKLIAAGEYTPLKERRPHVSAPLAGVLMRLLHKDPSQRYQSARAFLAALDGVEELVDAQSPDVLPAETSRHAESMVVELGSSMVVSLGSLDAGPASASVSPGDETARMRPASNGERGHSAPLPKVAGLSVQLSSAEPSNPFASQHRQEIEALPPDGHTRGSGHFVSSSVDRPPSVIFESSDAGDGLPSLEESSSQASVVDAPPSLAVSVFGEAIDGAINFAGVPSKAGPSAEVRPVVESAGEPSAMAFDPPTPSEPSMLAPAFAPKDANPAGPGGSWRPLALPAIAFLAIVGIGFLAVSMTGKSKEEAAPAYVDPDQLAKERAGAEELRRLERVPESMVPAVSQTRPVVSSGPGAEEPRPSPKRSQKLRRKTSSKEPQAALPAGDAAAQDEWSARFGARKLGHLSRDEVAPAASPAGAEAGATLADAKGLKLPVRLRHELSSSPPGPVVARLTKSMEVGPHKFPAGTELHGTTSGTAGTRILVRFTQAKLPAGQTVSFSGRALARDGRPGLKGRRTLGGATDVAASALEAGASSALSAAGDAIGQNPAGAAVKAGGTTAAKKSRTLNEAESIIVVQKSTRFIVYIDDLR